MKRSDGIVYSKLESPPIAGPLFLVSLDCRLLLKEVQIELRYNLRVHYHIY